MHKLRLLILSLFLLLLTTSVQAEETATTPVLRNWLEVFWSTVIDLEATISETFGWIDPVGADSDHHQEIGRNLDVEAVTEASFAWIDPVGLTTPDGDPTALAMPVDDTSSSTETN